MGYQALVHLLDPFLSLSLVRERPAVQDRTIRSPVRETLFRGKTDGGFGTLVGSTHLTAELMEGGSSTQGKTQGKGVCSLLCQGQRLLALRQPLVRITQAPQRPGAKAVASDTNIVRSEER